MKNVFSPLITILLLFLCLSLCFPFILTCSWRNLGLLRPLGLPTEQLFSFVHQRHSQQMGLLGRGFARIPLPI